MTTICIKCRHFLNNEPGSPREHVWYNHLCKANPLPRKVDPYDGELKPYSVNSLGAEYFSNVRYAYCRDVNDGECQDFQPTC